MVVVDNNYMTEEIYSLMMMSLDSKYEVNEQDKQLVIMVNRNMLMVMNIQKNNHMMLSNYLLQEKNSCYSWLLNKC